MPAERKLILAAALALLAASYGCSSGRSIDLSGLAEDIGSIPDAAPSSQPISRTGNHPYTVEAKTYVPAYAAAGSTERGIASWYGPKFHGKRTSSGERYDMYKMTAAHKTLLLPTYVSVKNLQNKRRIIVRVNDRGPFIGDRIIDLSYAAAKKLDLVQAGTGMVEVTVLAAPQGASATVAADKFYLSAGTFSSKSNANKLLRSIRSMGFSDVKVRDHIVGNSRLYQVRIGPIDSTQQVDAIIRQLTPKLPDKPYLVAE